MTVAHRMGRQELATRLAEAEATIHAFVTGGIDAVIDSTSRTPVLLAIAQAALRESEERYRTIVETASEGISIVDSEGKFTFANRRVAELLGYSVDELVGMPLSQIVPAGQETHTALRLAQSQRGVSEEHEAPYLRKDGTELWTLIRTTPIHDAGGRHVGTLGMMTDRTRFREAEGALLKSEAQYRQIVETTSDGIVQFDRRQAIVFVNRRLAEMVGYETGEMIGRNLYDFMDADARALVMESLRLRQLGTPRTIEVPYRRKDGVQIWVNITGSTLLDGVGQFAGSLGVVRDITERKKLESQLMVSDRMASVGTLAAGVAHEINNPLAAVIANLDFVAESARAAVDGDGILAPPRSAAWLREEIRGPIRDAREAAQRMRFIVRDLKVFSRASDDEPPGPVDVNPLMESSLRMANNEIRHRARVVRQYGLVPAVASNEARLGQVFLNLLVNASQALPDGRVELNEILVSTRREGDRVIIEVTDTGMGIPPEVVGRVFDAFFTTKAVGAGTGLGLAISHRLVANMGGELTVESRVGQGSTFRVSLPVARTKEVAVVTSAEPAASASRRGRILLVDDEEALLRVLTLMLSSDHEVVATSAAKEALALCAAGERFDLILCDLMMPRMTGMDLHRELARIAPDQASRMIFLTGGAFTPASQQFLADDSRAYIEKPFDTTNLRALIQRHLRGHS